MKGYIDIRELNTPPEKHELATAKFFANKGKNIRFIKPSNRRGEHTPDFWMDGIAWEVKSPQSSHHLTIQHAFQNATKQSSYIIFDLRRIKKAPDKAVLQLQKLFQYSRKTKKIKIITKTHKIIEIP